MPDLIILPDLDKRAPTLKLTPEIATAIVAALKDGSSRRGAARLAGIQETLLSSWLDDANRTQEEPFITLLDQVLKAEASYERRNIKEGQKVAKTTDDYLHLLKSHPAHRDIWGSQDDEAKGITIQIGGFGVKANMPTPVHLETVSIEAAAEPRRIEASDTKTVTE